MGDKGLFATGLCGCGVTAVCCFTPALVVLLGGLGLSAWLSWLDYVLFPALAAFAALAAWAGVRLWRRRRAA